jgi:hypothetical protein
MCFVDVSVLRDALDQLLAEDPSTGADTDTIEELLCQRSRLDALVAGAVAAFEAEGSWAPSGARTAVAWIAKRARLAKPEVRQLVNRGRRGRDHSKCRQAWTEGVISGAHLDVLSRLSRPDTAEAFARDEDLLIGHASRLTFAEFVRVANYWLQMADPDGVESDEEKRRGSRDAYLDQSFGGMWFGKMTFDPISGAIVSDELERLAQQMFESDWAEAKSRLGHEPSIDDLDRTPGQRRADAFVEMATRSKMVPADARRVGPLFSVLIDYPTFTGRVCELANGTVLSPGSLLPWLDSAYLERALFKPDDRVQVSHTARLFTGATRRGIELRDRECFHPYCDVRAADCQGDHVIPYGEGGATVQENGRMACGFHNRLRIARPPPAA